MDSSHNNSRIKSWVNLYSDDLYSWAFYKTSSKETAEDLVQETFLAAVESIDKFEERSNPKTWLFSILNHKINDHFRNKFKNPTVSEQQENESGTKSLFDTFFDAEEHWKKDETPGHWNEEPAHLLDDEEFNKVLENCLNKLPAVWNSAIQLKYMEDKTGEHICQELDISPTNFWQVIHRAKMQLRKCLQTNWFNN
jgi:RNA polymerase sigma-70 factor (TIGR02943 family)